MGRTQQERLVCLEQKGVTEPCPTWHQQLQQQPPCCVLLDLGKLLEWLHLEATYAEIILIIWASPSCPKCQRGWAWHWDTSAAFLDSHFLRV